MNNNFALCCISLLFLFLFKLFLFKLNPNKRRRLAEYKRAFHDLRGFIRQLIYDRYKEIEKEDFIQNDMLTTILNNNSNSFNTYYI